MRPPRRSTPGRELVDQNDGGLRAGMSPGAVSPVHAGKTAAQPAGLSGNYATRAGLMAILSECGDEIGMHGSCFHWSYLCPIAEILLSCIEGCAGVSGRRYSTAEPSRCCLALRVGQRGSEAPGNAPAAVLFCGSGAVKSFDGTLAWRKDSVYRWIETRRLPAHKIGRLWKFKLSEVDGWSANAGPTRRAATRVRGPVE